jgi:hypothetical protein
MNEPWTRKCIRDSSTADKIYGGVSSLSCAANTWGGRYLLECTCATLRACGVAVTHISLVLLGCTSTGVLFFCWVWRHYTFVVLLSCSLEALHSVVLLSCGVEALHFCSTSLLFGVEALHFCSTYLVWCGGTTLPSYFSRVVGRHYTSVVLLSFSRIVWRFLFYVTEGTCTGATGGAASRHRVPTKQYLEACLSVRSAQCSADA